MALKFEHTVVDASVAVLPKELKGVLVYWEGLTAGRLAPAWPEFHLDEIDPVILPRCTVVDVVDAGKDYVYRFWGTARVKLHDRDLTGKSIRDLKPPELANLGIEEFSQIVARRSPGWFTVTASGKSPTDETFTFWFLRMPLSSDGESVDKIVSFNHNRQTRFELEIFEQYRNSIRA